MKAEEKTVKITIYPGGHTGKSYRSGWMGSARTVKKMIQFKMAVTPNDVREVLRHLPQKQTNAHQPDAFAMGNRPTQLNDPKKIQAENNAVRWMEPVAPWRVQ